MLRRIEAADGSALHAIMGSPDVSRWLRPANVTTPFTPEECDDWARRRDAHWRAYRYTIVNREAPDPFLARTAWWVPEPLDLSLLRLGADPFLGEHDFATFCRKREGMTTTRRVLDASWLDLGDGVLRFDITATAFCWQMVRSIVGTLVDVGAGKIRPGELLGILRARDRNAAGRVGAPQGLCLWEVGY